MADQKGQTPSTTIGEDEWRDRLSKKVMRHVAEADRSEGRRRRACKVGGRMFYDQHHLTPAPRGRAAITANMAKALSKQKIAIMTKQDPIPVIQPVEVGSVEGARKMNLVCQHIWQERNLRITNRRALQLADVTMTCALKVVWDRQLGAGWGDVAVDLIPGWRLIVDNRAIDVERMRYIGDRAVMTRSQAMLLYPKSADRISELAQTITRGGGQGSTTTRYRGSPITDPWHSGLTLSTNDSYQVNNVPVIVTAAMSGPGPGTGDDTDTDVEIVELYHKDPTRYEVEETITDELGNDLEDPVEDEDGIPVYESLPDEIHQTEFGPINIPAFRQKTQKRTRKVLKAKYPFWRRSTVVFCGTKADCIDDRAWDGPAPYTLYTMEYPLDGALGKGPFLGLFTLQGVVNTSLSSGTDNIRQSSMQAFKAGSGSGVDTDQIILTAGKVIRCNDIKQLEELTSSGISAEWISWIQQVVSMMKFVYGLDGIMQGETTGRMDPSGPSVDTLAGLAGARVVCDTQNMDTSISNLFRIIGWFVQNFYTEKHAIHLENAEGQESWERVDKDSLAGQFRYSVRTGSDSGWSPSAKEQRVLNRYQQGLYDKVETWKELSIQNWPEIKQRLETQSPVLAGPAGGPPPRTRSSPHSAAKPKTNGAPSKV
jgi:hypothetical protein